MSELKLSDIIDDLKKCAELEIFSYEENEFTHHFIHFIFLPNPYIDFWFDSDQEIQWEDQALLVEALEQFVESKGYWFAFTMSVNAGYKQRTSIIRPASKTMQTYATAEAPTRLQAALACVIEVFGGEK